MRLATYEYRGEVRSGAVVGDWVVDLCRSYERVYSASPTARRDAESALPADLKQVLERGQAGLSAAGEIVDGAMAGVESDRDEWLGAGCVVRLADVRLWAPVLNPDKIICMGRNYAAHAAEGGGTAPEYPELFAKFKNSLVGHDWPIVLPTVSSEVDYEAELAVVIGRRARNVSKDDALDYVAGYTIMHDVSARDYQLRTSQWLAGKSMDTFAPTGPWIVTTDEIDDPQSLQLTLTIDGETLQDANTSTMVHRVDEVIEFISSFMTLEPGDIISTGTPEGVGMARDPQRYLKPGDIVQITVEKVGTLSNPVIKAG